MPVVAVRVVLGKHVLLGLLGLLLLLLLSPGSARDRAGRA
jgi:hypothetical protein